LEEGYRSRSVYGRTSGLVNEDHPLEPVTYYGILKKNVKE